MRRFFGRNDSSDLESELRNARPEPPADLLNELVNVMTRTPGRAPLRRSRLAAALVFSLVVLVALAAFGGIGYAKSSLVSATKSSSHAVTSVATRGHDDSKNQSSKNNGNNGNNSNNGNNGNNGNQNDHQQGGGQGHDDDPPWMHQYTRFVLVCYPFTIHIGRRDITIHTTIVVPRLLVRFFVPPGTLGACRFN